MIRSLGMQKIFTLGLLVAALLGIYFYGIMTLGPQNEYSERQLRLNKSEFSEITNNMGKLVSDMKQFDQQKDQFKNLEVLGFFNAQDRLEMRSRLNEMQEESKLISAVYSVQPARTEKNKQAEDAGSKIVNTSISFTLEAFDDADIYKFIYLLNYGFPGHVSINDLSIKRDKKITPTLLQKIGAGDQVAVVVATLSVNLRTMVEDPLAQAKSEEGAY